MSGTYIRIFICNFLIVHSNKKKILRFISIPNHLFTFTHKKISKHLPLYKLPSKTSGLKYLIMGQRIFLVGKLSFKRIA